MTGHNLYTESFSLTQENEFVASRSAFYDPTTEDKWHLYDWYSCHYTAVGITTIVDITRNDFRISVHDLRISFDQRYQRLEFTQFLFVQNAWDLQINTLSRYEIIE